MPSVWFMNGLHCRAVSAGLPVRRRRRLASRARPASSSATTPGSPGAPRTSARTSRTSSSRRLDPANPANYLVQGRRRSRSTVRHETIAVAGGDPVDDHVRETVHGPVLNDVDDRPRRTRGAATRSAGPRCRAGRISRGVPRRSTWPATFGSSATPSRDVRRAVAELRLCRRRRPHRLPAPRPDPDPAGRATTAGGRSRARPVTHDWTGYVPFDDLPSLYDPPAGIIVTANNAAGRRRVPVLTSATSGTRAGGPPGSCELLDAAAADGGVTQDDLSRIQNDTRLLRADDLVPALVAGRPDDRRRPRGPAPGRGWNGPATSTASAARPTR